MKTHQIVTAVVTITIAMVSSLFAKEDISSQQKYEQIILPKVEIRSLSTESAIDILRKLAKQNSADGKGVNIFLRIDDSHSKSTVTLTGTEMSLLAALKEVAKQSGMSLDITPIAASLN